MRIECKNLKKSYGDNLILDIPSFVIESGEFLGIVGENGCGKSTLLHILAGLEQDFQGEVSYDENRTVKEVQKEMTLVMQRPYMFSRSVRQNLMYPLKVRGMGSAEIKKKVKRSAEVFGLTELMEQRADRLSGGEMQKLNLARGLIFQPGLLMLDEPTANVDRAFTEKIEASLLEYYQEYRPTMILVTHAREQAGRLCSRVIRLERGKNYEVL